MIGKRPRLAVLVGLGLASCAQLADAQALTMGVVTALTGSATVERGSMPTPVPLRFRDSLAARDRITTDNASKLRILIASKGVLTMLERSTLAIDEAPATETLEIHRGRIALHVATDRMKAGEKIDVVTPNAIAAVRGTVLVAEVWRAEACSADPEGIVSRFTVLAGTVDVAWRGAMTGPAASLRRPEMIIISRCAPRIAPHLLAESEAAALAAEFNAPARSGPPPTRPTQPLPRLHP